MNRVKNVRMLLASVLLIASWCGLALAQTFPGKPVRIIVGYAPGAGVDVMVRLVADGLTQYWGKAVVVDNRPGASGIISMQELMKTKPEGYDYVFGDLGNMAINASYYRKLPYDPQKDLVPVVDLFWVPFIAFVAKDAPYKNLRDLVAAAKAAPGKYSYASTGTGSPLFAAAELFKLRSGVQMLQVPFKDMGQMLTMVATGEVTLIVTSMATVKPMVARLKPLAIAARQRQPEFGDIPTSQEAGGPPDFEVKAWGAVAALRGTPGPILDKFRSDAIVVMQRPALREKAAALGFTLSLGKTSEEMSQFIRSEIDRYREVINATGARGD